VGDPIMEYIFEHPLTRWPSMRHFNADQYAVNEYDQRQADIRNRDPELLPLMVFREDEVLRIDDSFALVELEVFRKVVRRLVPIETPSQGDRAWVLELRGALRFAESVDSAMSDLAATSGWTPKRHRTIYIMLSNDMNRQATTYETYVRGNKDHSKAVCKISDKS
jgi:hypothetical protein